MKLPKNLGTILLALYLILSGLGVFLNIGQLQLLLGVLAVAAGIVLLVGR